jgi:uncharacterized protein (UPF0210 family)
MIWVVDKQIVRHLIERGGRMAEVPVRVSFEYAVEAGAVVDGSLTLKTLYNKASVCKCFPGLDGAELEDEVQHTVERAIDEHLAMSGFER